MSATQGRKRLLVWLVFVLGCGAATAHAIPAPIPEKQLETDAHAIVIGTVVRASYQKVTTSGSYAKAHYRGVLKIRQVLKGAIKPGTVLPLHWTSERWIGKGRQPVGRGRPPVFYACEVVRVYLWKSKKGRYHVSGRRLVSAPSTYRAPTPRQKTLRCVRGLVVPKARTSR